MIFTYSELPDKNCDSSFLLDGVNELACSCVSVCRSVHIHNTMYKKAALAIEGWVCIDSRLQAIYERLLTFTMCYLTV